MDTLRFHVMDNNNANIAEIDTQPEIFIFTEPAILWSSSVLGFVTTGIAYTVNDVN